MSKIKLTKQEKQILEESLLYVKAFVEDSGNFYPFAMIMDTNEEIFSLAPELEDDFPESETIINVIEEAIGKEYDKNNNNYILSIMCIDVFVYEAINGSDVKRSAIEIRFIAPDYKAVHYLEYYIQLNNKLSVGNFIS